jgi:hypothetical protein
MRFEILVNGERHCIAGQEGYGILSAILTWCLKNPANFSPVRSGASLAQWSAPELSLHVGGLDSNVAAKSRDLDWNKGGQPLKLAVGDAVCIRILPPGPFDPPASGAARPLQLPWPQADSRTAIAAVTTIASSDTASAE